MRKALAAIVVVILGLLAVLWTGPSVSVEPARIAQAVVPRAPATIGQAVPKSGYRTVASETRPDGSAGPSDATFEMRLPEEGVRTEDIRASPRPTHVWPVSKDGIEGAVQERLHEILQCYQEWLEVEPELEGQLKVQFTIGEVEDGVGGVTGAKVLDDSTGHDLFSTCTLNVMGALEFDVPAEPVTVSYPLQFTHD